MRTTGNARALYAIANHWAGQFLAIDEFFTQQIRVVLNRQLGCSF